jgi:serine O-acetyltransferase
VLSHLKEDFLQKAAWVYGDRTWKSFLKAAVNDGSATMIAYRAAQTLRAMHAGFLGALALRLSALFTQAVIGRGADFGPGFVILHSTGVVINGRVKGGKNIFVEHGVTIGEEKGKVPVLGDDIFIGAGAKIFGGLRVGDRTRIGANAVVLKDVPDDSTAVGIPARMIPRK